MYTGCQYVLVQVCQVSVTKCEVLAIKSLMMRLLAPLGCQASELMLGGGGLISSRLAAMVTEIAWREAWSLEGGGHI